MKFYIYCLLIFFAFSCEVNSSVGTFDGEGYTKESISGSDVTLLKKMNKEGVVSEQGYVRNGLKNGIWTSYWNDGKHVKSIKSIEHFINGKRNGAFIRFNDRNRIIEISHFLNDELHGYHITYSWGSPSQEIYYSHGKIDGEMRVYFDKNGKLQKLVNFKDGVQDGVFKQYNDKGELILEYLYKNGKKVSGGPVAPEEREEVD